MAALSDIKRRIKSVKNTQQITKAMKMVSAAKLRRAQEDIVAARPYADKMSEMIAGLAGKISGDSHPLFSKEATGKAEIIVIASDRGLCGGFNSGLFRVAERFLAENNDSEFTLDLVGKRSIDYFKRRDAGEVKTALPIGNKRPDYALAASIAAGIIDNYLNEDGVDEVHIVYSEFQSALVQTPTIRKILPMEPPEEEETEQSQLLFEPSPEGVLDSLLPKYVEVEIFRALLESAASEHGARMTSMDSASKNASSMIDSLTLQYNRARQASITKELMEIISGAEAIQ